MRTKIFPALTALAFAGAIGLAAVPAARAAENDSNQGSAQNAAQHDGSQSGNQQYRTEAGKTGVDPRGTKAGPSTNPAQADRQAAKDPGSTGVGPRGTKVAPSTNPAANPAHNGNKTNQH